MADSDVLSTIAAAACGADLGRHGRCGAPVDCQQTLIWRSRPPHSPTLAWAEHQRAGPILGGGGCQLVRLGNQVTPPLHHTRMGPASACDAGLGRHGRCARVQGAPHTELPARRCRWYPPCLPMRVPNPVTAFSPACLPTLCSVHLSPPAALPFAHPQHHAGRRKFRSSLSLQLFH